MTPNQVITNLKGIFAPVVTPFTPRGDIDETRFRENLRRYVGIGLGGLVVSGSTGEAPYLTESERLRLIELARDIVKPPELLIAGTGLESTRATLALSREAIKGGADALLVLPPNYYKPRMDSTVLAAHYETVAEGLRRPVIIYSIPQFTGIDIAVDTIAALSRHPNIAGLKESSGNIAFVRVVLRKVQPGFKLLVGSVPILLDAWRAGAVGAVLGQADFAPEICVAAFEAFAQGKTKRAREMHQRLIPLAQRIALPYGVAGVKAALDLCGYHGGYPRLPLQPLSPSERESVAAALKEARAGLEF